jgi:hypothetical protein
MTPARSVSTFRRRAFAAGCIQPDDRTRCWPSGATYRNDRRLNCPANGSLQGPSFASPSPRSVGSRQGAVVAPLRFRIGRARSVRVAGRGRRAAAHRWGCCHRWRRADVSTIDWSFLKTDLGSGQS